MDKIVKKEFNKIFKNAKLIANNYVNLKIGNLLDVGENPIYELRDSLIYRSWSIHWHLRHLILQFTKFKEMVGTKIDVDDINTMMQHKYQTYFVLDDIIF